MLCFSFIFHMFFITLQTHFLSVLILSPLINVINVNGQSIVFPLTYSNTNEVITQCKCVAACDQSNIADNTDGLCVEQLCCKDPPLTSLPPACECMPQKTCEDASNGAGVIRPRNEGGTDCGAEDRICCTVQTDGAGSKTNLPLLPASPPTSPSQAPASTSTNLDNSSRCGYRGYVHTVHPRTNEAEDTNFGEFPWIVLILRRREDTGEYEEVCAGTLLDENVVLTAAHCLRKSPPFPKESLIIRAGEYDPNNREDDGQTHQDRKVKKITIHANYTSSVFYYDLALIKVEKSFITDDQYVYPICWTNDFLARQYDLSNCVSLGWGTGWNTKKIDQLRTLRKADMSIIDNEPCGEKLKSSGSFPIHFKVHENFICAEGHLKALTCHLDGGAPLMCPISGASNQYVLVGVLSWDVDCNKRELPTVFASVKHEIKWLQRERLTLNIF